MKAINLYNMVAGGTPVKKIKYKSYEFEFDNEVHDYYCKQFCDMGWLFDELKDLNEEVEIIEGYKEDKEEDKTIEKINIEFDDKNPYLDSEDGTRDYLLSESEVIINKLNEVIERLNEVTNNEEDSTND